MSYRDEQAKRDAANPWINRREVEPELVRTDGLHGDTYKHDAWGQISLHSLQGGHQALCGSDFRHNACVEIQIKRSILTRSLAHDWPHARGELINVRLTHAQWATFVSSMGQGSGVQCTINHVDGKPMPLFPLRDTRETFEGEGRVAVQEAANLLSALTADLEGGEFAGLSGTKRASALEKVKAARAKLSDSLPFITESFDKHMEKTVEKAKVEVHAYVNATITGAGLAAIERANAPLLLTSEPSP